VRGKRLLYVMEASRHGSSKGWKKGRVMLGGACGGWVAYMEFEKCVMGRLWFSRSWFAYYEGAATGVWWRQPMSLRLKFSTDGTITAFWLGRTLPFLQVRISFHVKIEAE
jgi:hypothetical protein